jgi:hypothetical protein
MDAGINQLRCMICRYDLRAHGDTACCPECGTSVEASQSHAATALDRQNLRVLAGVVIVLFAIHAVWNFAGPTSDHDATITDIAAAHGILWVIQAILYILILVAAVRSASIPNLILLGAGIVLSLLAAISHLVIFWGVLAFV